MKTSSHSTHRRRTVNLTLSEDLILQVRGMTKNLSGVVESLLKEYVEREQQVKCERQSQAQATAALWSDFEDKHGSFADEHSTL